MLHSLHSHSPHLVPTIHQNWSWEVGYLDTLHYLPVQGGVVAAGHPHLELHLLLPPLVVVHSMDPKNRIIFISGSPLFQVLAPPCESIPARLALVGADLPAALLAKDVVGDALPPAVPSLLRLLFSLFGVLKRLAGIFC